MQNLLPEQCAELIRQRQSLVVLTGAGVSTAAGIPDFRGANGMYVTRKYDPDKIFQIDWFYSEPAYFYEFTRDFLDSAHKIKPTFTHRFLSQLEESGRLSGIITQNIDLLHYQAGNKKVIDLHGSYNSAYCTGCERVFKDLDYSWWQTRMTASSTPPIARCSHCHGVVKPDIVFFGEMVNQYTYAERLTRNCDMLLVLGSSLQVAPASHLPHSTSATTLVVNRGEVMLGTAPHRYFVDEDLDEYFLRVSEAL